MPSSPRMIAAVAMAIGSVTLASLTLSAASSPAEAAAPDRASFTRWTTAAELGLGTVSQTRVSGGNVVLTSGTSGSWTSPWKSTTFPMRSLVPSWSAKTPDKTTAVIQARVRSGRTTGSWDTVATWAMGTDVTKRASGTTQSDDLARVSTDTVMANAGRTFDAYQIRVTLRRTTTRTTGPTLRAVNAVAATYATRTRPTSSTTMSRTVDLKVPQSSQMVHRGHFPQWGSGGEAWCSPTSTSMVLRYFGIGPSSSSYSFTKESRGYVDHAARYTFDHAYGGTGNWAFNTAYAAQYPTDAFVTRLYSLREAESFIKSGIPLVAGISFKRGELKGSPLSSTPGHLLVIRGFEADGDVIVNDPAATSDSTVRRVYQRAQFERAWMNGSGGMAYVIRPGSRPLPADTARW